MVLEDNKNLQLAVLDNDCDSTVEAVGCYMGIFVSRYQAERKRITLRIIGSSKSQG